MSPCNKKNQLKKDRRQETNDKNLSIWEIIINFFGTELAYWKLPATPIKCKQHI